MTIDDWLSNMLKISAEQNELSKQGNDAVILLFNMQFLNAYYLRVTTTSKEKLSSITKEEKQKIWKEILSDLFEVKEFINKLGNKAKYFDLEGFGADEQNRDDQEADS